MTKNLDDLDEMLMVAIGGFDVASVKSALQAGADPMYKRKRQAMPVGPMVTPVILSHRLRDIVLQPDVKTMRRVPPAVVRFLRESADSAKKTLGDDEVRTRIDEICRCIAAKLGH